MDDWRSYDAIADAYARIWAPRFETVARHLLALTPPIESWITTSRSTSTWRTAS
jgi:hypothetical protein